MGKGNLMAKKPARTWHMVVSLGIPLTIVGVSAMAISYVTLIDVARVNGLPLPELFPILIDVGTVTCMIAAAQFRLRGIGGRWLAYVTFILLSVVSIIANASHAWRAADMMITTPWAAALLAATPPTALLAITHLVMTLIPDEKERTRLQAQRDREAAPQSGKAPKADAVAATPINQSGAESGTLRLVKSPAMSVDQGAVREQIRAHYQATSERPTGAKVGEWLGGKSAKTGQRFLTKLEESGEFDELPAPSAVNGA